MDGRTQREDGALWRFALPRLYTARRLRAAAFVSNPKRALERRAAV